MPIVSKLGKQFSGLIEPSPLEYNRWGDIRRLSVIDTDFPEYTQEEEGGIGRSTYFSETSRKVYTGKTGRRLKNPRTEITPGATRGTAAFVDYTLDSPEYGYLNYMKVHPHYTSQGLVRAAVQEIYRQHPEHRFNWGKLMDEASGHLYKSFLASHPEQTGSGHKYY